MDSSCLAESSVAFSLNMYAVNVLTCLLSPVLSCATVRRAMQQRRHHSCACEDDNCDFSVVAGMAAACVPMFCISSDVFHAFTLLNLGGISGFKL